MRGCPLPKAKQYIEELTAIDPDAVKRASSLFPFGGAASATPDKSTVPASDKTPAAAAEGAAPAADVAPGSVAPTGQTVPTDKSAPGGKKVSGPPTGAAPGGKKTSQANKPAVDAAAADVRKLNTDQNCFRRTHRHKTAAA